MVGNSVRSDILPVIKLGGFGLHIPYHVTWDHEVVDAPKGTFCTVASISDVVEWLAAEH
jgi:putative hydrolase of the HAD superfamily